MRVKSLIPRSLSLLAVLPILVLPVALNAQSAEARAAREAQRRQIETEMRALREMNRAGQERALVLAREERAQRLAEVRERVRAAEERAQEVVVRMRAGIRLGVSLDPRQNEEYDAQGVLLKGVIDGSPAEEAGLEEGDIITHINGHSLLEPLPGDAEDDFDEDESLPVQRLMALADDLDEGDEVNLTYIREGRQVSVTFEADDMDDPFVWVSPGEFHFSRPDMEAFEKLEDRLENLHIERLEPGNLRIYSRREGAEPFSFNFSGWMPGHGLELAELNPGLGSYFSTEEGVLVLSVDEDSELGLRAGDVILGIGERDVEDRGDVSRILASYEKGETVAFRVMRGGEERRVEGVVR